MGRNLVKILMKIDEISKIFQRKEAAKLVKV
jgi:hypothetical protein